MKKDRIIKLACVAGGIVLVVIVALSAVIADKPEVITRAYWHKWNYDRKAAALKKAHSAEVRPLYDEIEVGMLRAPVERLLGEPNAPELEGNPEVWYLKSPPLLYHESPFAFGSIGVTYENDKVTSKRLNL